MTKKSDIINGFIQAKKSKKGRRLTKSQTVNRLLGSQVIHTNQVIKTSKLKLIKADDLSNRTIHHGFNKTIGDMRETLPRPQQKASKIIHNRGFEIISFAVNGLLLNPTTTVRAMIIFFILNLTYYSSCAIYNYYYSPLLVAILLVISLALGIASLILKRPK